MFCTSLRRRASFACALPSLTAASGLKESHLTSHDIALGLEATTDPKTGVSLVTRRLMLLLFSPSAVGGDQLQHTIERVQHFASLTGGQDLAIVFLLSQAMASSFISARQLACEEGGNAEGVRAYTKLQVELLDHPDIPNVPILPLVNLEDLPRMLLKLTTGTSRPGPYVKGPAPFELLQLCTASPPMAQQMAFMLSDIFQDLRELAQTCTSMESASGIGSPSAGPTSGSSSQHIAETQNSDDRPYSKMKKLRELVGRQDCQIIMEFWTEEWILD